MRKYIKQNKKLHLKKKWNNIKLNTHQEKMKKTVDAKVTKAAAKDKNHGWKE